jgi:hypothetical protein
MLYRCAPSGDGKVRRCDEVLAIVVDGVGSDDIKSYAVAVFSVTASATFRITSSTKSGWDSIGTWLLSVSKVFAPIRFATKRSKAGCAAAKVHTSVRSGSPF